MTGGKPRNDAHFINTLLQRGVVKCHEPKNRFSGFPVFKPLKRFGRSGVCKHPAEDVRLSTVSRVARALGKTVRIELVETMVK